MTTFATDWDSFDESEFVPPDDDQPEKRASALTAVLSLRDLVNDHPRLRPPVIHGLLRRGETMNVIASPKAGKSWLVDGVALSVVTGGEWLDTFRCESGRVLLIDGELHVENIAHRLPMVAAAMGIGLDYLDHIDVWPLRGQSADLIKLAPRLNEIEAGQYALIILDAWYRFLPPGVSENDNAAVMSLYNLIDGYASKLEAAWINVHHASKGDQSGKGVTDVGSGAGAQSRAADAHLVIRQHEDEGVAVIDAVVRSFPPVERLAIRFDFPVWFLDRDADPNAIRKPQKQFSQENKDRHLEADRKAIVNAMHQLDRPETKSFVRESAGVGNPRFGYAWASLLLDETVVQCEELVKRGNNQSYESFRLNNEESLG